MGRLLLVRHGQASFGAEDYDVLSEVGHTQARLVGALLAERGFVPDVVIHGALKRQRDTAAGLVEGGGFEAPLQLDPRWDEFDHLALPLAFAAGDPADMRTMDKAEFQRVFEAAAGRWASGEVPTGATDVESFVQFGARVRDALEHAARQAGPDATVIAVSSGGPISLVAGLLLDLDGPALTAAWGRLSSVIVNSSVTTVVAGSTGARLLTFNEHPHLAGDLLTYR